MTSHADADRAVAELGRPRAPRAAPSRSATTTPAAPSAATRRASARPIPDAPPVTTATRPVTAALSLPSPTQPSPARSPRASRSRRGAGGPTISAGRVVRSISNRGRSSRRRLTPRCQMSARNPPSLPSVGRRWMPTPLKPADRSQPSAGPAHAPIPILRFSDSCDKTLALASLDVESCPC